MATDLREIRSARSGDHWVVTDSAQSGRSSGAYAKRLNADNLVMRLALRACGKTHEPVLCVTSEGAFVVSTGTYPQRGFLSEEADDGRR